MKSDYQRILTVGTCLITTVLVCVKAVCPPKPLAKVHECTANLIPDFSQGVNEQNTDTIQNVQEKCRNFKLRETAKCIQDILDNCHGNTDDEHTLRQLFDKDKTMKTVEYFCNHIKVYERSLGCISKHHEETANCSKEGHKSFVIKERAGAHIDVLITGSCRFYEIARGCITNTTDKYCGAEASNFIYTLITGTMPPYCSTVYNPVATTSSSYVSDNGNGASCDVTSYSNILLLGLFLVNKWYTYAFV